VPPELEALIALISDDFRYRDLHASDYITFGRALVTIVLAESPETFQYLPR